MSGVNALMGLGFPAAQANELGITVTAKTGVGTAQATAVAITSNYTRLTTAGGATASVLPAAVPVGAQYTVRTISSTAGLVFPESGGTIDGGSTDASVSIAQNRSRVFTKVAALTWESVYGA